VKFIKATSQHSMIRH